MSIYKMLTYKMSIYKPVPSDDSMHTSSIPGRRAGSRCLVRERRDQPRTAHTPLQLGQAMKLFGSVFWARAHLSGLKQLN